MRWLTGWSGGVPAAGASPAAGDAGYGRARAAARGERPGLRGAPSALLGPDPLDSVRPLAATRLWAGPDPLWAVGDWRADEIRILTLDPGSPPTMTLGFPPQTQQDGLRDAIAPAALAARTRLAVLGRCAATEEELLAGLAATRGGAVRQLSNWPGSYTVVLQLPSRSTILLTDLAGALPVFHTPWCGGTAYATAALPLADLVGAPLDLGHLAARLACPESPEVLGTGTPYLGVQRVLPGHSLAIRTGRPHLTAYDAPPPTTGGPQRLSEAPAVRELTRTLLEAVRCRIRTPETVPPGYRSERPQTSDRPRIGADLSGGTASGTLALLAAMTPAPPPAVTDAVPPQPRVRTGAVKGSWTRAAEPPKDPLPLPFTAVTYHESPQDPDPAAEAEAEAESTAGHSPLARATAVAGSLGSRKDGADRLRHTVVRATPETLPYAELADDPLLGPLTDEPGPALVSAARINARLGAGGTDHLTGHGARQVLDGHPARLADLVRDRRRRDLLGPVTALSRADRALVGGVLGSVAVLRAAHRLARVPYAEALLDAAGRLQARRSPTTRSPTAASAGDLAWCVPGPAARWLSDEALAAVAQRLRLAAGGPVPTAQPGERRARLALHHHAAEYRTLHQATEQHGQRLHAPFFDNQVIRAARLLPDAVRLQPGARHTLLRAVLTGAGQSELPPDWGVASHPDRTAATRAGLEAAADGLAQVFRASLLAEAGLIDLPAVRGVLRLTADATTQLPPGTLTGLADLVSTELWLRRYRARQDGSCWTGMPLAERRALAAARFS